MSVSDPFLPQKQHYLPAVYLKQFSTDGKNATRTSQIWRLGGKGSQEVSVESQCHERFFYSASAPAEAEQFFQSFEGPYGELAQTIWRKEQNKNLKEYFGLILFMVSLHLRNPAYEIRQRNIARIDIYKLLEQQFVHHVLLRGSGKVPTNDELFDILKEKWRVKLFSTTTGALVTSDNPVLWYSMDESGDVHWILLPVTPYCCAIAFDHTTVAVNGFELTASDEENVNREQTSSMIKALYAHEPFCPDVVSAAPEFWSRHQSPKGWIDADTWQMNVRRYKGRLNFIQPITSIS